MATHKNVANVLADATLSATPASSSPLRRKSVVPQKLISSALSENDDEAERLARRREINTTSTPVPAANTSDKRRSLGLGFLVHMPENQMAERISQCIKLGTENKINPKNAFSLEMIDFMTYMIKKQDVNMSNLQVASTSLDVSTKIYGFRVDGVHMDILKMIGGLEKQEKDNKSQINDTERMDTENGNVSPNAEKQEKKKKKKNKQRIFTTVEALRTNVETEKPSLITMEADSHTTDMLYQAILPNHANSGFFPHPYNDILVDTVESKDTRDISAVISIPNIEDFSHMEICPPFFYFDFQTWNAEDEPDEIRPENNDESRFQFDLDASLPHDDEPPPTSMNYFDIEVNEEENIHTCARAPDQVENIVDFRKVLTTTIKAKVSEYSFIQKNLNIHWAGPSHWKMTNFKKALGNSRVIETCRQAPIKKKKEVQLCYDDEMMKSVNTKFLRSNTSKMHARTAKIEWNEDILLLPPDEHYNIAQANKLYLHTMILNNPDDEGEMNATHLSDDIENYNYCNENDISNYCPDINNGECQENEKNDANTGIRTEDEGMLGTQTAFTGDNLVAIPKLTNKSTIAYCVRAKKIDMRQLKKSIWKCLTIQDNENRMDVHTLAQQDADNKMNDTKHFSVVYKELPFILSKNNVEALSFPISFVSLLHLANEKTLKVTSPLDMSDLIVKAD